MHRALCCICLVAGLAAEANVDLELNARLLTEVVGQVHTLAKAEVVPAPPLIERPPEINLFLVRADGAGLRQALAHAAGAWWLQHKGLRLTRASSLPVDPATLRTRAIKVHLPDRDDLVEVVRDYLAPWLVERHCGIAHDPATGTWSATLGPDGHAQLAAILDVLQQGRPCGPALLLKPVVPPPAGLDGPIAAAGWREAILRLGRLTGTSVSVGQGVLRRDRREGLAGVTVEGGDLAEARVFLAGHGIRSAYLHGVLCFDTDEPVDRLHPARRRRLMVLPVGHLVEPAAVPAFVERIRREVTPWWWRHPGARITWLADTASLLVAVDDRAANELGRWLIAREDETP